MRPLSLVGGMLVLAIASPVLAQADASSPPEVLHRISSCVQDVGHQKQLTPEDYRARTELRREGALSCAQSIPGDGSIPQDASNPIRSALSADILDWRNEFGIGRKEFQDVQARWLIDRDLLTPWDWAQRRVEWFYFRDAWIAKERSWASANAAPTFAESELKF